MIVTPTIQNRTIYPPRIEFDNFSSVEHRTLNTAVWCSLWFCTLSDRYFTYYYLPIESRLTMC